MVEILKAKDFFEDDPVPICVFRIPNYEHSRKEHAHDFHEIMIIVSGVATHHYKGAEETISMGDVFVIPPFDCHAYDVKGNCGVEVLNVLFDLNGLKMDLGDIEKVPGYHALFSAKHPKHLQPHLKLNARDLATVTSIVESIETEQESFAPGNGFARQTKLRALMLFLARRYSHVVNPTARKVHEMDEVLSYMEKHLADAVHFEDLANLTEKSPTTFRRAFHDTFGCSPMAYLQQLRIKKAMLLLADPLQSISEVAFAVGFNDSGYFSRVFKQETGESPKAFRQNL